MFIHNILKKQTIIINVLQLVFNFLYISMNTEAMRNVIYWWRIFNPDNEIIQTDPQLGKNWIFQNVIPKTEKSLYKLSNSILFSGVVHHDDQMYLFFMSAIVPYFTPEDPETKIVERQTKMWANFIQTG